MTQSRKQPQLLQSGVGLTELLVSMFIGLFILAGVVQMVGTSSQNAVSTNGVSRLQENIRFAFSRIEDDMARSGNMGCFSHSLNADIVNARAVGGVPVQGVTLINNLLNNKTNQYEFANMVGGVNDLPNGSALGVETTDTFYVRFVDQAARLRVDSLSNSGNLKVADKDSPVFTDIKQDDVIMISDCSHTAILMVSGTTNQGVINWNNTHVGTSFNKGQRNQSVDTGLSEKTSFDPNVSNIDSLAYIYAGQTGVFRYFIGQSALGVQEGEACVANGNNDNAKYCALFRAGSGNAEELVQGVHGLQVEYGWTGDQPVVDAAGNSINSPLQFATANNMAAADWNQVDRIKVTLSLNSVEEVAAEGNNSSLLTQTLERIIYLPNQI